jgi:hypothetical protein
VQSGKAQSAIASARVGPGCHVSPYRSLETGVIEHGDEDVQDLQLHSLPESSTISRNTLGA